MEYRIIIGLMFVLLMAPLLHSDVPKEYILKDNISISVPANVEWYDTGIILREEDYVIMRASGRWRYDPRPQFEVGPNGLATDEGYPGFKQGALIARIGNSSPFFIGKYWEGYSHSRGILLMGMHDETQYENNIGELNVSVEVYRKNAIDEANASIKENESEVQVENVMQKETAEDNKNKEESVCITLLVLLGLANITLYFNKSLR